jgi:ankyrin repeat protein
VPAPKESKPQKGNSAWWSYDFSYSFSPYQLAYLFALKTKNIVLISYNSAAANEANFKVAVEAIKNGQDVNERNPKQNKATALHLAVSSGAFDMVELLLQHGADLNITDNSNMNALDFAIAAVNFKVIQALKAKGASLETSQSGLQPLCRAALVPSGSVLVAALLFAGAKVVFSLCLFFLLTALTLSI